LSCCASSTCSAEIGEPSATITAILIAILVLEADFHPPSRAVIAIVAPVVIIVSVHPPITRRFTMIPITAHVLVIAFLRSPIPVHTEVFSAFPVFFSRLF
jgi:hypothetical protein